MAITRRGGVRLEVENYEVFIRQLNTASASLGNLGKAAEQTAAEVTISAQQYGTLGVALAGVGTAALTAIAGLGLYGSRVEELNALLGITRQNAVRAAEAEAELAAEGYILTEQGEEYVGTALAINAQQAAMAKAMALSSGAVEKQVEGIRALHLSGKVATETVAALIRYNLDWTKATELARLAQDAATFAMQDSSQAIEGLIHGITTLQPRVLRSYGIMVNLNEAYRDYAAQNNLVATQLTQAQRQQAALNAVLAQGPSIAGAYEAAMGTAAKQIRSLNTDIQDFSEAFGQFFTPVLGIAVGGVRDLLHWLTELPDPVRATVIEVGAMGSGLLVLVGTLLKARSALLAFTGAASVAQAASALLSSTLLGPVGLIAAIGGLVTLGVYLKNVEEAHRDEAASILETADTYEGYISRLEEAEIGSYALSEALYEEARAHIVAADAADQHAAALEFQDAAQGAIDFLDVIAEFPSVAKQFVGEGEEMQSWLDLFEEELRSTIGELEYNELTVLRNRDAVLAWARAQTDSIEDAKALADVIMALAGTYQGYLDEQKKELAAAKTLKDTMQDSTVLMDGWILTIKGADAASVQYENSLRGLQASTENLLAAEKARYNQLVKLADLYDDFAEDEAKAFETANSKISDAVVKRNRALEDLDTEYQNKAIDAWIEFQRDIADSEADLAAYHAGTLQELLDLDREYLRDRNDAWAEYQQDLADAERELQRNIEDANRERAQALQDLDREYAQDLEDARRDLNQDLEDMAREHAQNLQDIEEERIQDQLDLEQEYQRRLYDIQNAGQQRLLELQLEYEEKASDTRLRYLREALEAIEGGFYAPDFEQTLRELFLGLREFGPGEIPNEFREAYEQMLEDLEQLRDDQYWEEQDLSDDIDREYDQRMADLEQWLADEQAAIDAAYEERMAAEQERYAREQEERQRDYDRKLEDLRIARERERQEIERDHQQRLADLRLQHERERQEIALNYQRRLEDLQIEYERERQLIGEKLEEQNETARQKYQEALEDISRAKEREREEINKQYARTKEDILADYEDTVTKSAEKFGELPEKFQPVYDRLETQARDEMAAVRQAIMNEINALFADLQARSPSRVMMKLADSIMSGLEAGGLNPDAASDLIGKAFSAQAFQANIQAALPASMAAMPIQGSTSSVTNASTSNLTVNAQYRHQSEASLRNDLALYNNMMRAWGR